MTVAQYMQAGFKRKQAQFLAELDSTRSTEPAPKSPLVLAMNEALNPKKLPWEK